MNIAELLGYANIIGLLVLGFLQWRTTARDQKSKELTNGASAFSVNVDTLRKLSQRIDELEARDATKEARINDLEEQVKKWKRGYNRALNFIHQEVRNRDIPDFLQDTGELNKR